MRQDRIDKLRAMANQDASPKERDVARKKLTEAGIDWKHPKKKEPQQSTWNNAWEDFFRQQTEDIFNQYTSNVQPVLEHTIKIKYPTDLLLLSLLYNKYSTTKENLFIRNSEVGFKCKQKEADKILQEFESRKVNFSQKLTTYASSFVP